MTIDRLLSSLFRPSALTALGLTVFLLLAIAVPAPAAESLCPGGTNPDPGVIWCDDFDDGVPIGSKYFEYNSNSGDFVPKSGQGINGSTAMQVVWQPGEVEAGNLKRTFGRNPIGSQSHSSIDFMEIYWRMYVKMDAGWTGNPAKLSRATVFATPGWAQAMIAHIWGGTSDYLTMDPASGIDLNGNLATTTYNDFPNLRWLGNIRGTTPIYSVVNSGKWHCVEAHVRLNAGASDGVFEFWINGNLEARRADLNWVGAWQGYGINAVFFENYWNSGAPGLRVRHFDNIVISTGRIGCLGSDTVAPSPPTNLNSN